MESARATLAELSVLPNARFWVSQQDLEHYCKITTENIYDECVGDRDVSHGEVGRCVLSYFQRHGGEIIHEKFPRMFGYAFFTTLSDEDLTRYGKAIFTLMGPSAGDYSDVDIPRSLSVLICLDHYGFDIPDNFSSKNISKILPRGQQHTLGRYWLFVYHQQYLSRRR